MKEYKFEISGHAPETMIKRAQKMLLKALETGSSQEYNSSNGLTSIDVYDLKKLVAYISNEKKKRVGRNAYVTVKGYSATVILIK